MTDEEFDRKVEEWHVSKSPLPLAEFLGMTFSEYANAVDARANNGIAEYKRRRITMTQKPSIGRIVHYQRFGSPGGEHKPEPSPAVITKIEADGETCHLFVMNPNGCYFNKTPYAGAEPKPGCWNWPPRV